MNNTDNNKWLEDALSKSIGSEKTIANFEQWKEKHPHAVETLTSRADSATKSPLKIRNIIMKNPIIKFAVAAVIIIVISLSLIPFDKSITSSAYAFDQTIDAIRQVKTVYMEGEFYSQGKFECWMQYDGDPDWPTHIWLGRTGQNLCRICSPEGVFGLNRRTNSVYFAKRDERDKNWYIKFASFFADSVKQAQNNKTVDIYNENDPETGKELIVVHIKTSDREQKFYVDPQTKLPISFDTIRGDNPIETLSYTLIVKNLDIIHYNQQPPEGIFDLPDDAVIVEEEVDYMVDPDSGLIADGMTRQEACLEIVRQTGQALIDLDIETLCSLDLFYRLYNPDIWEQIKKMKNTGQWANEFNIIGEPYQEDELWYVPCEIKTEDEQSEIQNAMIKFYNMKGKTYCFIIGSKEKGVVD